MMDYVLKRTRVLRKKRYKIIFICFFHWNCLLVSRWGDHKQLINGLFINGGTSFFFRERGGSPIDLISKYLFVLVRVLDSAIDIRCIRQRITFQSRDRPTSLAESQLPVKPSNDV